MSTMSRKLFSEEEMAELKQNPHVTTVTPRSVNFTAEFKQTVYESIIRGERIAEVLERYGINTGILGEARIRGLWQRIMAVSERSEGFERKKPQPKLPTTEEESMAKRLKRLENELAYTKQEVEFLKKTQVADLEARRQWESKRKPR